MIAPPRSVCALCDLIVLDPWPVVVAISRPGEPAETFEVCPQCGDAEADRLRHRRGRGHAPAPLRDRVAPRGRVRVGAVGSAAWGRLFGEDDR